MNQVAAWEGLSIFAGGVPSVRSRVSLRRMALSLAAAGVMAATLAPGTSPAVALSCDTAAANRAPSSGNDVQANDVVVCLINAERARRGLPLLTVNQNLTKAAQQHATAAIQLKWWGPGKDSHTNPQTHSTPQSRIMGAGYCPNPRSWAVREITYTGWGGLGTPKAAVNWWVNVSTWGHREIVLDPNLRDIGRAALPGAADRSGAGASGAGTYVVTFGRCQQ